MNKNYDFHFTVPQDIEFGPGSLGKLPEFLKKNKSEHVFLISDHGLEAIGLVKKVEDIIKDAGYGDYFGHGLGHSVGLFIHEEPRFSPKCKDILEPGMVITVEPGIYLPGEFGVRIEDLVVVTEDGYRNLAESPKELICI